MARQSRLPAPKPRPVAFCLAGFSPAVVTETLYALAVYRRPRIIPSRVVILTTADAYSKIVSELAGSDGAIRRLASEYRLPKNSLHCSPDDVVILRSRSGQPLRDIRSSSDSRDAGEAIAAMLAELHADPDVELHCSLAGGRKTMGALLALALQMCARPGDRLYHVLVNEPFEKIPEFLYPPRRRRYFTFNGKRVDSARARIDLAEVPLIRLGMVAESLGLGAEDLARRAAQMEAGVNIRFRPPCLTLASERQTIQVEDAVIHLPTQQFVLYSLYASLRQSCTSCLAGSACCAQCHPTDDELFANWREKLREAYTSYRPMRGEKLVDLLSDRSGTAEKREEFGGWLRQTRSKINRTIRSRSSAGLVPGGVLIRKAESSGCAKENRRGLSIPPKSIHLSNVAKPRNQR